jgi:hypothetical protein
MNPFAGYKRVGNDNTLLLGVSMQLKVRDHNQADIARAEADLKSAEFRLQLVKNHALAEVESAYASMQTAADIVQTFQRELLQQADETQSIAISAYEEGGTELLPVLRRSAPGQKFDSNTSKHCSTIERASSKWSLQQEGTFSREEFQYKQSHVGRDASHFCRSIRSWNIPSSKVGRR